MSDYDPRPINRSELARFLPSDRAIRAIEQIFNYVPDIINQLVGFAGDSKIQVLTVTADYTVTAGTFIIMVDASAGPVAITLPDATTEISDYYNAFFTIGIGKIDTSSNAVTVVPQAGQTIVGETSFDLVLDGEILNLASDLSNWQLAS